MTAGGPSARSLLSVLLTEYVLPGRGTVQTSTLLEAMSVIGVMDPAARQAIRRLAQDGIIERSAASAWRLTESGRETLAGFRSHHARTTRAEQVVWDRRWLLVRTTVPETQRSLRHALRRDLGARGFGSLGQGWFIHPDLRAEAAAQDVLARLDIKDTALTFTASSANVGTPEEIVASAWNLDEVRKRWEAVIDEFRRRRPVDELARFRAWTLLLQWRTWASAIDPWLPRELLPEHWVGEVANEFVRERYQHWQGAAASWWVEREPSN
jgi:phenylacetic acid degradation operon negative regulatory protein